MAMAPGSEGDGAVPGDGRDDAANRDDSMLPAHFSPERTQMPALACVFKGVGDGLAGAVMGSVFGFGSGLFQRKGFKGAVQSGVASAKTFAILSGLHGFITTLLFQIRGKKDALNAGIAGCATGIVLSTPGNPAALLQGCATFGVFSYLIERMNTQVAVAAPIAHSKSRRPRQQQAADLSLPALPPFTLAPAFMEGLFLFNQPRLQMLGLEEAKRIL